MAKVLLRASYPDWIFGYCDQPADAAEGEREAEIISVSDGVLAPVPGRRGEPVHPFTSRVGKTRIALASYPAPGAAAELAENVPGLELGVRALAG